MRPSLAPTVAAPTIVIHGIAGCELYDHAVSPPRELYGFSWSNFWFEGLSERFRALTLCPRRPPDSRGVKIQVGAPSADVYGTLADSIRAIEYSDCDSFSSTFKMPCHLHAWDWRLGLEHQLDDLHLCIQEQVAATKHRLSGTSAGARYNGEFNLVGHSAGGVIIAAYLRKYHSSSTQRTSSSAERPSKVITIGTPFAGSPFTLVEATTDLRENFSQRWLTQWFSSSASLPSKVRCFALMPSLYQMYPTFRGAFSDAPNAAGVDSPSFDQRHWHSGLTDFWSYVGGDGTGVELAAESQAAAMQQAKEFMVDTVSQLELANTTLSPDCWLPIVGCGEHTAVQLRRTNDQDEGAKLHPFVVSKYSTEGDGVVPLCSTVVPSLSDEHLVCVGPAEELLLGSSLHTMLPRHPVVQELVASFLGGKPMSASAMGKFGNAPSTPPDAWAWRNQFSAAPIHNDHAESPLIPNFAGDVHVRPTTPQAWDHPYHRATYQFASTTFPERCNPTAVIYASSVADVIAAVAYAALERIAISVRSGGHQYSSYSSTTGKNLQLDVSNLTSWSFNEVDETVTVGSGWKLIDLAMKHHKLRHPSNGSIGAFFPHGECGFIGVGGHLHTGGYSMLSHSFGMFADHIMSFRIVVAPTESNPEPSIRNVSRGEDLFFAVIGGSPGSFGVVVDVTIRVRWDCDHGQCRFHRRVFKKNDQHVSRLLALVNSPEVQQQDLFLSVITYDDATVLDDVGTIDNNMETQFPHEVGVREHRLIISDFILIDALWLDAGRGPYPESAERVFQTLIAMADEYADDAILHFEHERQDFVGDNLRQSHTDLRPPSDIILATMTSWQRLIPTPYNQRNFGCSGGASPAAGRIAAEAMSGRIPGIVRFLQMGSSSKDSRLLQGKGETALPRTVDTIQLWSAFARTEDLGRATTLLDEVERRMRTETQLHVQPLMWGTVNDDKPLDESYEHFYTPETYQRVLATKRAVDPFHVFTSHQFNVGYTESRRRCTKD